MSNIKLYRDGLATGGGGHAPPSSENKLYRVVTDGKKTGFYLSKRGMMTDFIVEELEEYTPPAPLELGQLIHDANQFIINELEGSHNYPQGAKLLLKFLEPHLSAILQAKDEKIVGLNKSVSFCTRRIREFESEKISSSASYIGKYGNEQISDLQAKLEKSEARIKELEDELIKKNI